LRTRYEETVRRTQLQMEDKARRIQALQERLSETQGLQARLDAAQARLQTLESGQELALADADHRHGQAPGTDPKVAGAVSRTGDTDPAARERTGGAVGRMPSHGKPAAA